MKALMLSWEFPPHNVGGLGKHVMELVPALARAGVEVYLLTPGWSGTSGEEVVEQVATVRADVAPAATTIFRVEPPSEDIADFFTHAMRMNVAIGDAGRQLLRDGTYDLIHAHDWLVAFAGVGLKHEFRVPLVATIHATEYGRNRGLPAGDVPRAIHNVEWWLTYEAWRVICCSQYMASEIQTIFTTPADKLDVIPNGVDPGRFDALAGVDLTEFRRQYASPDESIVYCVGRVVHEKGVHVLVEAMPHILATRTGTKFIIAGAGGALSQCRARVQELGLADKVYFTGFISDETRDRLFRVADVAVFPSLYEPFGIVAIEAMAAGTPVVASAVGGLDEVVDLHETGIKVYPNDPRSIAWGVLHTLDNPAWAAARVANAGRVVRERFNWEGVARDTVSVYERVVAERRRADW